MKFDHDALFAAYLPHIENLNHPNNKLYITFSAVTGAGKSWLAKRIAKRFSGLYLSADSVRQAAVELWPTISGQDLDELIASFAPSIQNRLLDYPNKLHIVDTNIDRFADQVFDKAKEINFPLYIIRVDVEKNLLVERIKSRQQNKFQAAGELLRSLDANLEYHEHFKRVYYERVKYSYTDNDEFKRLGDDIAAALAASD